MTTMDSGNLLFKQKDATLKKLKEEYNIDEDLYNELRVFCKFDSENRNNELSEFMSELPENLAVRVSRRLYRDYRKKINFFRDVNNHYFIAWICPKLVPR